MKNTRKIAFITIGALTATLAIGIIGVGIGNAMGKKEPIGKIYKNAEPSDRDNARGEGKRQADDADVQKGPHNDEMKEDCDGNGPNGERGHKGEKAQDPKSDERMGNTVSKKRPRGEPRNDDGQKEQRGKRGMNQEKSGSIIKGELDETTIEHILFMKEEERLAHDIYIALAEHHNIDLPFLRIAESEQKHMNAVDRLIDINGLENPTGDLVPGEYAFDELNKLYAELLEQGKKSEKDANAVGVAVEKADIADLEDALKDVEDPSTVRVFENLLKGSEKHLKAFDKFYRNM